MTGTDRHPPAWYRDPRTDGQLRRWNGWRWTGETRPYPSWLGDVRVATGPRRRPDGFGLWVAAACCFAAAIFTIVVPEAPPAEGSDRFTDPVYAVRVDGLCAQVAEHFRDTDGPKGQPGQLARSRADAWAALLSSIREVPVTSPDDDVNGRWLSAWDQWIVDGRAYADALGAGDAAGAETISQRSAPAKRVIDSIAVASGMGACRFVG